MPRYQPVGGDDFDGLTCDLDGQHDAPNKGGTGNNDEESPEGLTRHLVVKAMLMAAGAAVAVTGVYGIFTHDGRR